MRAELLAHRTRPTSCKSRSLTSVEPYDARIAAIRATPEMFDASRTRAREHARASTDQVAQIGASALGIDLKNLFDAGVLISISTRRGRSMVRRGRARRTHGVCLFAVTFHPRAYRLAGQCVHVGDDHCVDGGAASFGRPGAES